MPSRFRHIKIEALVNDINTPRQANPLEYFLLFSRLKGGKFPTTYLPLLTRSSHSAILSCVYERASRDACSQSVQSLYSLWLPPLACCRSPDFEGMKKQLTSSVLPGTKAKHLCIFTALLMAGMDEVTKCEAPA